MNDHQKLATSYTEWNTNFIDIVTRSTRKVPCLAQPVTFYFHLESTLDNRVASELRQRALREFIDLRYFYLEYLTVRRRVLRTHMCCDAVLFKERFLFGHKLL